MSVPNGEKLATKQDLADMYQGILPYLGGMPEVLANKFSKGDLYSTDEKMIGQWIDGKPLYQRTLDIPAITAQVGSNDYIPIIADGTNYEVKSLVGFVNNGSGSVVVLPEVDNYSRTVIRPIVRNTSSNNAICINIKHRGAEDNPQPYNLVKGGKLTIKYTKVSDTAISIGSDTDYSTEEKIVGTWIDEKPIYSRTYTGTTPSTVSSSTPLQIPIGASIERVIDAKVVFFNSNGTHYVGTLVATMGMDKGIRFNFQSNSHPTAPNIYEIFCTQESWCNLTYYLTVFYTKTT